MSAFYISNIENYLFRDGSFPRYIDNVKKLPHSDKSVIIRSLFGGYQLPESAPGYYSTSAIQKIDESAGELRINTVPRILRSAETVTSA